MTRNTIYLLSIVLFLWTSCTQKKDDAALAKLTQLLNEKRVLLPNGWKLSPAGETQPLGDLPLNLVVSSQGKYMAVTNNGQSKQTITLIDAAQATILDDTEIAKSWYGLTFNQEETRLYASGGNDNLIVVYDIRENKLIRIDSIVLGKPWPVKISPTGIALDDASGKLFIATKEDSSLYAADIATKEIKKLKLNHEAYAVLLSPDHKTIYVTLWGGDKVAVIDRENFSVQATINVGSNPNDMVLTRDGEILYVSHANDNAVSVIETASQKVIEVLTSSVVPDSPAGSTPNSVALSADEDRLYIANADNNCLAVFDVEERGEGKSLGFIPTGWYPTSVKVFDGKIWVTSGKGLRSFANPKGPNPYESRTDSTEYIARMFKGTLSVLEEPDDETLKIYTQAVFLNTPYNKEVEAMAEGEEGNPVPRKKGEVSPIKYVFYVIKENRSYDQVLGDMTSGNGDSTLCLFPERVTPNQHALANAFVLLDNFYVNAEVSADGHNWSTAAYANDYVEKTWPISYGNRGGSYDYEGSREIAHPKDGFIWDYCARAGVSYRSYGEFVYNGKASLASLEGHFDKDYPSYNLNVTDMVRFERWKSDFDSLISIHAGPSLNTIRMPNDHTAGARAGMPTPRAMVAENDLAVGSLIDHISRSAIWKESAIFILEDDAQNGPDHVDAHRSPAYVISPYAKRNVTISRMYSTASVLRTMELILGLPPMSQYDAAATPMWECFQKEPQPAAYSVIGARYDIHEMNKDNTALAERSSHFNLAVMDAVPDLEFSEVIWKAVKGMDSNMPAPVRSAFILPFEDEDEEN